MSGASWTCGSCGFANPDPGPCSQCGAADSSGAAPDQALADGEGYAVSPGSPAPAAHAALPLALIPPPAVPTRAAPQRSCVAAAYVVWFLYLLGYVGLAFGAVAWFIAGALANILGLVLVNRSRQKTGIAPKGRELLTFLLVTHFAIPVLLVLGLLSVKVLYDDDVLTSSAAPFARQVSERFDRLGSIVGLGRPVDDQSDTLRLVRSSSPTATLTPTPTPTPDPWLAAVGEAKAVLDNAPGFERNLQAHQQSARQVSDQISVVEETRPLLTTVAGIRSKGLPFVGNLWDGILKAINGVRPGAGDALDGLVDFLENVSAFKARLDGLPSVDPVIAATSAFRAQPSRMSLVAMDEAMQAVHDPLAQFDQELSGYLGQVDELVSSLDALEEGLQGAGSKWPQLADRLGAIGGAVEQAVDPVRDLQTSMREWHSEIQSGLEVMDSIHRVVEAVKE